MEINELIAIAFKAIENAYIPYSKFGVGACVELNDGTTIKGCNIENAAYGSTMCAERNAVYATYCQGYKKEDIKSLTIVADATPLISPCGACRQVLAELLKEDTTIVLANKKEHRVTNIKELLPYSFTGEAL